MQKYTQIRVLGSESPTLSRCLSFSLLLIPLASTDIWRIADSGDENSGLRTWKRKKSELMSSDASEKFLKKDKAEQEVHQLLIEEQQMKEKKEEAAKEKARKAMDSISNMYFSMDSDSKNSLSRRSRAKTIGKVDASFLSELEDEARFVSQKQKAEDILADLSAAAASVPLDDPSQPIDSPSQKKKKKKEKKISSPSTDKEFDSSKPSQEPVKSRVRSWTLERLRGPRPPLDLEGLKKPETIGSNQPTPPLSDRTILSSASEEGADISPKLRNWTMHRQSIPSDPNACQLPSEPGAISPKSKPVVLPPPISPKGKSQATPPATTSPKPSLSSSGPFSGGVSPAQEAESPKLRSWTTKRTTPRKDSEDEERAQRQSSDISRMISAEAIQIAMAKKKSSDN